MPRPPWPRRALRLAAVAAAAAFAVAAAIVVAEVALRVIPGLMPPEAERRARLFADLASVRTQPHPTIGFLYPSNYESTMRHHDAEFRFRTDSRGFRNAGPWPARADIVVLGDSVTFGFGVPDDRSWVALLARGLPGTVVVNLALPGLGPLQHLEVYRAFASGLRPRLVLIGLFPGNDFWDTAKYLEWQRLGKGGNYMLWRDFGVTEDDARSRRRQWLKSSYLVSLLWTLRNPDRAQRYGGNPIVHETATGPILLFPRVLEEVRERTRPGRLEFEEAFRALVALNRLVADSGGRLLVVLLPTKEDVYLPVKGLMQGDPLEHVYRRLEELSLPYLDLTPPLRQAAERGERLYFHTDGHPNARGYAVIARVVAEHLRRPGLAHRPRGDADPRDAGGTGSRGAGFSARATGKAPVVPAAAPSR